MRSSLCVRYAVRTRDPMYGNWFYRFYYDIFALPLSKLSKKFIPESEAAVNELLSFQVEVEVFRALNIAKYPIFRCLFIII